MKKILYIITQSDFGGAQRYVFDLATRLSGEFEVVVAAGKDGNAELFNNLRKSDFRKIKIIRLKHLSRAINPWHDLLAFFEIRNLIKKELPDIIHLNSTKAGIIGSLASRFVFWNSRRESALRHALSRATPFVIYTAHGWVFNEPLNYFKKKLYFWLEKFTAKYKNKIICVSEYDKQVALKNNFPPEKLIAIYNGIDFNNLNFLPKDKAKEILFSKIHNSKLIIHNSTIIGSIANLYPAKGIEYLIEAAKIIIKRNDTREGVTSPNNSLTAVIPKTYNLKFIVIGEGEERPKLEALIKKYYLENNFFLLGHIPNASQYLKAFDIFVLPSVKEGLPYALLEAASAEIPVIATRVGGVPEIFSTNIAKTNSSSLPFQKTPSFPPPFSKGGLGGILINPKTSKELAEKIIYLLQNQEISHKLAENNLAIAQSKFGIDKMIEKTKQIYNQ